MQRVREVLSNTFSQQHRQSRSRQGASRFAAEPDPQHLSQPNNANAAAADQECQGTCPAAYETQQLNLTRALPRPAQRSPKTSCTATSAMHPFRRSHHTVTTDDASSWTSCSVMSMADQVRHLIGARSGGHPAPTP